MIYDEPRIFFYWQLSWVRSSLMLLLTAWIDSVLFCTVMQNWRVMEHIVTQTTDRMKQSWANLRNTCRARACGSHRAVDRSRGPSKPEISLAVTSYIPTCHISPERRATYCHVTRDRLHAVSRHDWRNCGLTAGSLLRWEMNGMKQMIAVLGRPKTSQFQV